MSNSLTRRLANFSLLCLASFVQPLAGQNIPASANQGIADDDGFWKTASLREDADLNVDALRQHQTLCERTGADACLVIHRGKIVQEWYSKTYSVPMYAMSSTKSVAGLLTGMLIDDGRIKSIDARVCDFILTWCTGRRGAVSVRHLLSMTSGLPMMRDSSVGFVKD